MESCIDIDKLDFRYYYVEAIFEPDCDETAMAVLTWLLVAYENAILQVVPDFPGIERFYPGMVFPDVILPWKAVVPITVEQINRRCEANIAPSRTPPAGRKAGN